MITRNEISTVLNLQSSFSEVGSDLRKQRRQYFYAREMIQWSDILLVKFVCVLCHVGQFVMICTAYIEQQFLHIPGMRTRFTYNFAIQYCGDFSFFSFSTSNPLCGSIGSTYIQFCNFSIMPTTCLAKSELLNSYLTVVVSVSWL